VGDGFVIYYKRICLVFLCLILIFPETGCQKQSQNPEDIKSYQMGEEFECLGSRYKFTDLKVLDSIAKKEPSEGAVFIMVKYSEENLSTESKPVGLLRYKLVDSQGRKFSFSSKARWAQGFSEYKDLLASQIHPGIKLNLAVIFEVPEDAGGFYLEISHFGTTKAKVKL